MSRNFSSKQPYAAMGRVSLRAKAGRAVYQFLPDIAHYENAAPHHEGVSICPSCHAIFQNKHLEFNDELYEELNQRPDIPKRVCEGCDRVNREQFQGIVRIHSPMVRTHGSELLHRIYSEEQRARQVNPVARIAKIVKHEDSIEIFTTTAWLAKRIGTELEKAYHGHLTVQKLPRTPFIRVVWDRED